MISFNDNAPLAAGRYANPLLNGVSYAVSGSLVAGTPSGFPAFALQRDIHGAEFYAQGSSLRFTIDAGADPSDGLHVSELTGTTGVFVFNGHENNTGRFHPALLQLNSDGTGSIRNSDNIGAGPGKNIDVDFGEEYITNFTFDPAFATLAARCRYRAPYCYSSAPSPAADSGHDGDRCRADGLQREVARRVGCALEGSARRSER